MQVLNDQAFAICVVMALFSTFISTPMVMVVYKPARRGAPYKRKTIQRDPDTELRMLACFHNTHNIPSLINLIECSRGTERKGKLCIYTMHLMELSERSSAITMVHMARKNGMPFWNKKRNGKDQMIIAFQDYEKLSGVSVRPMTVISGLNSIHEDICTTAHRKRAAMIILPFHKQQRVDGTMESVGHSFQEMNQLVLCHAPCSVGIFVDRGLGGTSQVQASDVSYEIVVPFFGGHDDREALCYGMRMGEHPGIFVNVYKFVTPAGTSLVGESSNKNTKAMDVIDGNDYDDKKEDDELWNEFLSACNRSSQETMKYEEKVVESKGDIEIALKEMNRCNLIVVGRMPSVAALGSISDCPELGPVGSFVASSDFSTVTSVMVIQQYNPSTDIHPFVREESDLPDIADAPRG